MSAVKQVEIDGKKYPVRYGMNAYCEFEEITGKSLISGFAYMDVRSIRALIYTGLKAGHKFEYDGNKPFDKTIEDVGEMVDLKSNVFKQCMDILHESLGLDKEKQGESQAETLGE